MSGVKLDTLIGSIAGAGLIVVLATVWKLVVGPELDKRRAFDEVRLNKSVEIEREQTKQTENLKSLGDRLVHALQHAENRHG